MTGWKALWSGCTSFYYKQLSLHEVAACTPESLQILKPVTVHDLHTNLWNHIFLYVVAILLLPSSIFPQVLHGVEGGVPDTTLHGGEPATHTLDALHSRGFQSVCGMWTSCFTKQEPLSRRWSGFRQVRGVQIWHSGAFSSPPPASSRPTTEMTAQSYDQIRLTHCVCYRQAVLHWQAAGNPRCYGTWRKIQRMQQCDCPPQHTFVFI